MRLIVDKTAARERGGKTLTVAQAGIPVWVDYELRIAHNKVIVIDDAVLLQGSLNWTTTADHSNAENLLVSRNSARQRSMSIIFSPASPRARRWHSSKPRNNDELPPPRLGTAVDYIQAISWRCACEGMPPALAATSLPTPPAPSLHALGSPATL